jgi:hypothetical protein
MPYRETTPMNNKAILPSVKVPDIQHTFPEVFIFESLSKMGRGQGTISDFDSGGF